MCEEPDMRLEATWKGSGQIMVEIWYLGLHNKQEIFKESDRNLGEGGGGISNPKHSRSPLECKDEVSLISL